jgi:hypothetical protein
MSSHRNYSPASYQLFSCSYYCTTGSQFEYSVVVCRGHPPYWQRNHNVPMAERFSSKFCPHVIQTQHVKQSIKKEKLLLATALRMHH